MVVPQLLLETLEDMLEDDFKKFKWHLTYKFSDRYQPIPKAHVEPSTRIDVITKMIERYGEEEAVQITEDILKMMQQINAAKKLRNAYTAEEKRAAASTVTPPSASISAQQESVVIAPVLTNSNAGTINITINKP
ncbi:pyrin-like [Melanotaenia boesemani]|uniref:pyrin-like n=1 Tax=Melanotaenia boesemani TaxID=1250792 RepID=UPI001C05A897|nr:pyrin-like [Melanotaenia boesemani]